VVILFMRFADPDAIVSLIGYFWNYV